ncbi:MAG: hypothetical protein WCZ90_09985 [Melioribacteraceae bacterium]
MKKINKSRKFYYVCIALAIMNICGCSSFLIKDTEGIEKDKIGKIVLKDNSEIFFFDESNKLVELTNENLVYLDSIGNEHVVPIFDVKRFYEYKIDGVKILFVTLLITLPIVYRYIFVGHGT